MTTITIAKSVLKAAIAKMVPVLDTRSIALPITKAILFAAAPGRLELSGTDYDAFLRLDVSAEVTGQWCRILLSGQRLNQIVSHLPDVAVVKIELTETSATITAGQSVFELGSVTHADDFPVMPEMGSDGPTVPAKAFVDTLTRCAVFASREDCRAVLGSVCVENGLAIATDRYRLVKMETPDIGGPYLLHAQSIPVLTRLFGQFDGDLTISADQSRMQICSDDAVLQIRLVDGQYPNYAPLLVESPTRHFLANREELVASVARSALGHRLTFTLDRDLALSAQEEKGTGTTADVVELLERGGDPEPITWMLSASYTLAALRALTDEVVMVSVTSPTEATFFRDAVTVTGAVVLVQPLR